MPVMHINDLALELLCRVFRMAVYDEEADTAAAAKYKSPRTAVMLSHTCSYWRQVCIAYPGLWTFLPLDYMSKELYRLFVERSRRSSMLSLYFERGQLTLDREEYGDVLQRAARLHVCSVLNVDLGCPREFQHLQELVIKHKTPKFQPYQALRMEFPGLRKLHLEGFFIPATTAAPLPRLTDLRLVLASVESEDLLPILSAAPNLEIFYLSIDELEDSGNILASVDVIPLLAVRSVTVGIPHDIFRHFMDAISLPKARGYNLVLTPFWVRDRPSPDAILHCIPTNTITLPLSRGTSTEVDITYRTAQIFDIWVRNYVGDRDQHRSLHSAIRVVLGPRRHWTASGIVQVLDALTLHPETGTNDQVTIFEADKHLIESSWCDRLPRDMFKTRFPRLEQFRYQHERGGNLKKLVDLLEQIAPAPPPLDADFPKPVHHGGPCPRTLGFDRLDISGMDLGCGSYGLPSLLANTTVMRLLSGVTLVFVWCRVFASDEHELDTLFRTEAAATFGVNVWLDSCQALLRSGHPGEWIRIGTAKPRLAGKSALGT